MKSLKVEHQKPGDGVAEENCGEIIAKERIRVLSHIKEQLQVLCAEEEEKKSLQEYRRQQWAVDAFNI